MDDPKSRPDEKSAPAKGASPGIRTPFAGESSSNNVTLPPADKAKLGDSRTLGYDAEQTLVDAKPQAGAEVTQLDADATMAGTAVARSPVPPSSLRTSAGYDSAAVLQIGEVLAGNYVLGDVLRQSGDAKQAADYYRAAISKWDEEQKEVGDPAFLSRADLAQMYKDAQQQVQGLK